MTNDVSKDGLVVYDYQKIYEQTNKAIEVLR